jgi:hypothetical protein
MPDGFRQMQALMMRRVGGDREMVDVLALVLHHDEQAAENVVPIGGPGNGKTHDANAVGIQLIERHRRTVRFFSTIEIVNAHEKEKAREKAGHMAEGMIRLDLATLDELGDLRFSAPGGALLSHRPSKLYEHTSAIITTNLGFREWAVRHFPRTAMPARRQLAATAAAWLRPVSRPRRARSRPAAQARPARPRPFLDQRDHGFDPHLQRFEQRTVPHQLFDHLQEMFEPRLALAALVGNADDLSLTVLQDPCRGHIGPHGAFMATPRRRIMRLHQELEWLANVQGIVRPVIDKVVKSNPWHVRRPLMRATPGITGGAIRTAGR